MKELIERYQVEKRAMLECARLNPKEGGNSIFMQLAIAADKKIVALRLVGRLTPDFDA